MGGGKIDLSSQPLKGAYLMKYLVLLNASLLSCFCFSSIAPSKKTIIGKIVKYDKKTVTISSKTPTGKTEKINVSRDSIIERFKFKTGDCVSASGGDCFGTGTRFFKYY